MNSITGVSLIGFAKGQEGGGARPYDPSKRAFFGPEFAWARPEEVASALQKAQDAAPIWATLGHKPKADFLRLIAQGIEDNAARIIELATQETALPSGRIQGEIGRTTGQLRLFAKLVEEGWWRDVRIDHSDPSRKPVPKPDVRSMLVPVGPVAVFSSSNFPLAFSVAGGDTASAFAAGCPVIVKAHQGHLATSECVGNIIVEAVRQSGLPEGSFSLLFGPGRSVGMALVTHPAIQAVGFTGSRSGGRALMDAAAARPRPIPVYAEMGSINPMVILPGALTDRSQLLAAGLAGSVTLGNGQFCTNPGLILLEAGPQTDAFLQQLGSELAKVAPGAMLTESICHEFLDGLSKFTELPEIAVHTKVEATPGQVGPILLTTSGQYFLAQPALLEELFGPATVAVLCNGIEEITKVVLALDGQLTGTIHASPEDYEQVKTLYPILAGKVGRLVHNGFPTGVEVCHAMNHGGPYPASADGRSTSVGTRAITRFARPLCWQNTPEFLLPEELKESNPLGLLRLVNGTWNKDLPE